MKIDFTSPKIQLTLGILGGAFIGFVFGVIEPQSSKAK